jgi:exodeoxyribonuclease VII large subunit
MATSRLAVPTAPAASAAAPAPRRVFSVWRVVSRADEVIRQAAGAVWVRGEVSGWKRHRSGHCYFTLKDDRAELCCTLWASTARHLPALPEDGMQVEVQGQLGIFVRRGQFQLDVQRVETTRAGGLWQVARDRLVAALREEGLLDEDRKRPLPTWPERVGVVTSAQSAALHDMHRTMRRKAWWVPMLVSHTAVEGAEAAPEIAAAIRRFGARREECPVDVVIVARGGGSMESLWAFNMEPVARAIAACPVPVISAVGHETDYTVADLVADFRAATPTAGAERAVPEGREVAAFVAGFAEEGRARVLRAAGRRAELLEAQERAAGHAFGRRMALAEGGIAGAALHLEARSPRRLLEGTEERLRRAAGDLHAGMRRRLDALDADAADAQVEMEAAVHDRLEALEQRLALGAEGLDARSPLRVLARGYAVVSRADGARPVRSAAEVAPDDRLRVRLAEGELRVRVEAAEPEPSGAREPNLS